MTVAEDSLASAERICAAADRPSVSVEEERAKAGAILDGLAEGRLLWAPAPVEAGGLGLPILDVARVVAAASAVSGSAGLIAAMHLAQVFALLRHGTGDGLSTFAAGAAQAQMLLASGTSEVGVGGDILRSVCRTQAREGGGWRLDKSFANISYLDRAGATLATAMHHDGRREAQRLILLRTADIQIAAERETALLGMRGMVHRAVTVEASFESDAIFAAPFGVIARTMSAASHVLWSAAWSGLATAALTRAGSVAAASARPAASEARLEAAAARLGAMNATIRDACAAFDAGTETGSPIAWGARFNTLKIACAEALGEIVAECGAVAGFRGYAEGGPHSLSEIVRDSFSARVMVSSDRLASANAAVRGLVCERI